MNSTTSADPQAIGSIEDATGAPRRLPWELVGALVRPDKLAAAYEPFSEEMLTAWMAIAGHGYSILIGALLAKWASLGRAVDRYGETALMKAARHGQDHCFPPLLPHSDPTAADHCGMTALMHAARGTQGDYRAGGAAAGARCVEALLAAGFDARATDKRGNTALMWAARVGDADSVRHLLPHSAPLARNRNGWTALMFATRGPWLSTAKPFGCVQLLLPHSDVWATNTKGRTALRIALNHDNARIAALIAEHCSPGRRRVVLARFGADRLPEMPARCEADELQAAVRATAPKNEPTARASISPSEEVARDEKRPPVQRATRRI